MRDVSSYSRWKQRDPQLDSRQRVRDLGTISPKWDVSFQSVPLGLRELCRREDGRMERAKGDRRQQENKTFYTRHTPMNSPNWSSLHRTCTGLSQVGWDPRAESESGHQPHLLPRNHLQLTTAHKGKVKFSPTKSHWVSKPHMGRAHAQKQMANTKLNQ